MQLSKNFTTREFTCRCGCGFGTNPGDIDLRLISGLQQLRDSLGVPIFISSGCRCPEHNKRVGGAELSQLTLGTAADIYTHTETPLRVAQAADDIEEFAYGGIGLYIQRGFVHVDVRPNRARFGDRF